MQHLIKRLRYPGVLQLLAIAACLGLTALVYWPGLSGPFMLDDGPNIENGYVENFGWDWIVYTVTHNGSGFLGRSVSMLSFVLTELQYGLDPYGFKLHNLLLHLLAGVALFRLLQGLLPRLDARLDAHRILLVAGMCTALWLLHPLMVSTVLYAVQRMAQLSALFTLLAMLAYLNARTADGKRFYFFGWLVLPLMTVLAVLSKESGVLVPLYLLLIELCVFRSGWRELFASRRLAVFVGVFILLPLVAGTLVLALNFDRFTDYSMRAFTMKERLLTEVHIVFFYLRLLFLPRIRDMSLFHDDFPLTTQLDFGTLLLLLVFAAAVGLAWKLRKTLPVVSFAVLWFFIAHLLESTFVPLELVFEHRNYLASIGPLLLPVYGLVRLDNHRALRVLGLALIVLCAFMTRIRAAEWGNRDLFYEVTIIEHPASPRARNNYANYLMGAGRNADAIRQIEELTELTPTDLGAFLHLQVAKCSVGQRDDAALARGVELAGQHAMAAYGHSALQAFTVRVIEGKCPGISVDDVEPIVAAALDYAERNQVSYSLDNLYRIRAMLAMADGNYAQGYSDFRVAYEISGRADQLHELMQYQVRAGRLGDAEEILELMEQRNAARFGIDTYVVNESRKLLASARDGSVAGDASADGATRAAEL